MSANCCTVYIHVEAKALLQYLKFVLFVGSGRNMPDCRLSKSNMVMLICEHYYLFPPSILMAFFQVNLG